MKRASVLRAAFVVAVLIVLAVWNTPFAASASSYTSIDDVMAGLNYIRQSAGLRSLVLDPGLSSVIAAQCSRGGGNPRFIDNDTPGVAKALRRLRITGTVEGVVMRAEIPALPLAVDSRARAFIDMCFNPGATAIGLARRQSGGSVYGILILDGAGN